MQVTTYAKLEPGASPRVVESKIPELVEKYAPAAFRRIGFSYEELISNGGHWDFVLQKMDDIYLGSGEIGNRLGPLGSRVYVYLFSVIAAFVLFLACINFMNLVTARSGQRAQETGIRKTLGSTKQMLVSQFLMESMVYALTALPLALLIAAGVVPVQHWLGKQRPALSVAPILLFALPTLSLLRVVARCAMNEPPSLDPSIVTPSRIASSGPSGSWSRGSDR